MTFAEIIAAIGGEVVCDPDHGDPEVTCCCGSDLMSDVLTLDHKKGSLLITGLAHIQTIRTADMADIRHIIFVRDKKITEEMIEFAKEAEISIGTTKKSMFNTCGEVFAAGIQPAS